MKISNVVIKNYRNIKDINISLNDNVVLIGDNNSGKSNFLKALTLPLINHETGYVNKLLNWQDINKEAKEDYFNFLKKNKSEIISGNIEVDKFKDIIPNVQVILDFEISNSEEIYFVRNWLKEIDEENIVASIKYEFMVDNPKELFEYVAEVLEKNDEINIIKMNLLPLEYYSYKIINPLKDDNVSLSDLSYFKYNSLAAERDEFSNKPTKLGSKSLVTLLNSKLEVHDKTRIETSYENFLSELKNIESIDGIFNWQTDSFINNAEEFFEEITLLPNIPTIKSLLNNVRLGYGEEYLDTQGLGYRNLIYLFVMMNALSLEKNVALNVLTIEEPEAHLSISNKRLLASYINAITKEDAQLQIFISTHSQEFLNKLKLENVVIFNNGKAKSLKQELENKHINYLSKKPNLDFLKFLFSRNCILVEGPTEELLIKNFLSTHSNELNDIEVITLNHKGFRDMMHIWLLVNEGTQNKLGIIRDYDNQPKALKAHEVYNDYENIYVKTTRYYTLEDEIVNTDENYMILKKYFEQEHQWGDIENAKDLSDKWKSKKADTMLRFCQDIGEDLLTDIKMPKHINDVIHFIQNGEKL